MINDTIIAVPAVPAARRRGLRSKPYIDWFFGCVLFSLITLGAGVTLFDEYGDACFLCHEDVGWALVVFAYAAPGLVIARRVSSEVSFQFSADANEQSYSAKSSM
jgi:hypothetical protein